MRHYLLEKVETETTVIRSKPLFFPVRFDLPEGMKEALPASVTRQFTGTIVMRFYCTPQAGDEILQGQLVWRVTHLRHEPKRRGSPKNDEVPTVFTEFVGEVE